MITWITPRMPKNIMYVKIGRKVFHSRNHHVKKLSIMKSIINEQKMMYLSHTSLFYSRY